jgi:hypothetical protein
MTSRVPVPRAEPKQKERARGLTPQELARNKIQQRENAINKGIEIVNARLHAAYDPLDPKKGCIIPKIDYPEDALKEILCAFTKHWTVQEGPVIEEKTKDIYHWIFTPKENIDVHV